MSDVTDLRALEDFETGNADLGRLEARISAFNIFEAVGITRQEIRHSHFLAFLLDPSQNHGMGDGFLKRFLTLAIEANPSKSLMGPPVDTDTITLDDAQVAREQDNIDIRVIVPLHRLVIIIENKIYSGERFDQLPRYIKIIQERFPEWSILPIYLTLYGTKPTEGRYFTLGYQQVAITVDEVAEGSKSTISSEVYSALKQYITMLRRHHLADTEIDSLCASIYQRHKRALDLIFERRPDRIMEIAGIARRIVNETPEFHVVHTDKTHVAFQIPEWHHMPALFAMSCESKPVRTCGLMLFLDHRPEGVTMSLQIVPVEEVLRQKLWSFAGAAGAPFRKRAVMPAEWPKIYLSKWLSPSEMAEWEIEEIEEHLRQLWHSFLSEDLRILNNAIKDEFDEPISS